VYLAGATSVTAPVVAGWGIALGLTAVATGLAMVWTGSRRRVPTREEVER
jgi:hypothetical protein